jgi:hypothetical protein
VSDDLSTAFAKLVAAAEGLPEIEQTTSYGTPSLKVRKKFLCRVKDSDTVVVACPLEEKELLMEAAPEFYFETDHYKCWPAILVRVHAIPANELSLRINRAWQMQAPKSLQKVQEKR